jgi:hypothetical protein
MVQAAMDLVEFEQVPALGEPTTVHFVVAGIAAIPLMRMDVVAGTRPSSAAR